MRRRWKILIGALVALIALLVLNAVVIDNAAKSAEVTVDGGQIISLPDGELQVAESGPGRPKGAGSPIVLIHCYGCSLRWWDRTVPLLSEGHRVIRIDLLGFGGSEKQSSGYGIERQGQLVAAALRKLHVRGATVVGHSMGAVVATAVAEQSDDLVERLVNIDMAPDRSFGDLSFVARLGHVPLIGEALWRVRVEGLIKGQYGQAFAPDYELESGFEDPDQVVEDNEAMTYTSFDESHDAIDDYRDEIPLDERLARVGVPLMVIFGSESQVQDDPEASAQAYSDVPDARIEMIEGAGHSPNVERPEETAGLIIEFAAEATAGERRRDGRRDRRRLR